MSIFAAFCIFSLGCVAPIRATPDTANNASQFVLLKNGQIVEGQTQLQQNKIILHKQTGSQIRFGKHEVEAICQSAEEAYWSKYSMLSATDTNGHVSLLLWCLQRELFVEA
ncbi:MAG: hypothetical protein AAGA30_11685, partial [Planctomycetota bacterium]